MKTVDINKKKVFYIDVDQKQCDYLQRLGMEVDARLEHMKRIERKQQREAERKQKLTYKLFHKVACACGIM